MTCIATLLPPTMSARHVSFRRRLWAASALACTLATITPSALAAQMGGMGGGGMGGGLTKEQQIAFKSLRKEMQRMQAPLFKDLDKLFGDMPQRGGRGGGSPPAGGMGGGAPDTVRVVVGRLSDIQDSFRDRAREQLTALQRTRADSLQQVMLAEERAKSEKEREKRPPRR